MARIPCAHLLQYHSIDPAVANPHQSRRPPRELRWPCQWHWWLCEPDQLHRDHEPARLSIGHIACQRALDPVPVVPDVYVRQII